MSQKTPIYLTVLQAAELLGKPIESHAERKSADNAVRMMMKRGQLPGVIRLVSPRRVLIERAVLIAWLDAHRVDGLRGAHGSVVWPVGSASPSGGGR